MKTICRTLQDNSAEPEVWECETNNIKSIHGYFKKIKLRSSRRWMRKHPSKPYVTPKLQVWRTFTTSCFVANGHDSLKFTPQTFQWKLGVAQRASDIRNCTRNNKHFYMLKEKPSLHMYLVTANKK